MDIRDSFSRVKNHWNEEKEICSTASGILLPSTPLMVNIHFSLNLFTKYRIFARILIEFPVGAGINIINSKPEGTICYYLLR